MPRVSRRTLFTIGYEGHSIDSFMRTLTENKVKVLCDVRKNPISRKRGFSKNQLKGISEQFNIEYVSIPQLGIESKMRKNLNTEKDYQNLFNNYKKSVLKTEMDSLRSIIDILDREKRVAITCFEREPEMCHRHCVAQSIKAICKKIDKNLSVVNL